MSVMPKSFMNGTTLNRHVMSHAGEKPYKCKLCEKSFTSRYTLKTHAASHAGEKPWKCQFCEKYFIQNSYLKVHMRTHTGEKPYKCQLCEKPFAQDCNLKAHMRVHTREKPYTCEGCHISFSSYGYLNCHVITHTGEKPYKCQLCDKSYTGSTGLKVHMRTHIGEKPYKCKLCEKSYTESTCLKGHMRTHPGEKPYKCQLCEKSFTGNGDLKRHVRTRTGGKPYTYQICHKSFKTVSDLNSHSCMLIQTGDVRYLCVLCNRRFACAISLRKHRRIHAAEKQHTLHRSCSSLKLPIHHAGTQPRCLNLDNNSPALSGAAVIDKPNECLSTNTPADSGEENTPLASSSVKECHYKSITEPLEKSFGCSLRGEMLEIENDFEDHRPSHHVSPPDDLFNDMGRFCIHCKPNSSSFAQKLKCYAFTQPQCPKIEHQSAACLSVPFKTLYGADVIDETTECLSMSMYNGSSGISNPLVKIPVEGSLSIKSQEDGKPVLENSFGCGICGEMLTIEKEFQDHCSSHPLSPPHDLCIY